MSKAAIDPGKLGSGVAVFDDYGYLAWAGYAQPWDLFELTDWHPDPIVIEKPQVYSMKYSKGDPNDLIDVAIVAGEWGGRNKHAVVTYIKPKDWKGQIPKEVTRSRVMAELRSDELENIHWPKQKSLRHNVLDAIHLGLRHFTTRKV